MKDQFDARYSGGRPPMTISFDLEWLEAASNVDALTQFVGESGSRLPE